jgi:hypothetical protein
MLDIKCDMCGRRLSEPGAIVFSPPLKGAWTVEKYHVCADCWPVIATLFTPEKELPPA